MTKIRKTVYTNHHAMHIIISHFKISNVLFEEHNVKHFSTVIVVIL